MNENEKNVELATNILLKGKCLGFHEWNLKPVMLSVRLQINAICCNTPNKKSCMQLVHARINLGIGGVHVQLRCVQLSARIKFSQSNSIVSPTMQFNFVLNKALLIWFLFLHRIVFMFLLFVFFVLFFQSSFTTKTFKTKSSFSFYY